MILHETIINIIIRLNVNIIVIILALKEKLNVNKYVKLIFIFL